MHIVTFPVQKCCCHEHAPDLASCYHLHWLCVSIATPNSGQSYKLSRVQNADELKCQDWVQHRSSRWWCGVLQMQARKCIEFGMFHSGCWYV